MTSKSPNRSQSDSVRVKGKSERRHQKDRSAHLALNQKRKFQLTAHLALRRPRFFPAILSAKRVLNATTPHLALIFVSSESLQTRNTDTDSDMN